MASTEIPLIVKHAGQKYEVTADLTQPGEVFKALLYSLTNVEPERQKILVKGGQLKDDADMSKLGLKPGQTLMMMGTPSGKVIQAPKQKMQFVEDMTDAELASRKGAIPAGFQNLGNTCYLNSTLQTLRYIPELQEELGKYKPHESGSGGGGLGAFGGFGGGSGNLFGSSTSSDLPASLRDLYKQINSTTEGYAPLMFVNALRNAFPQFAQKDKTGHYSQQDAEECYSQILHELQVKMKSPSESQGFIQKYMGGSMQVKYQLKEGGVEETPAETQELFLNLKCHIGNKTNFLKDGLLEGLKEDIEKQSTALGRMAVYEKTCKINRLPKYLTCHFVRFFWRKDIKKKVKIMRKVTFPFELDATDLCCDDLKQRIIPARDRLRNLHKDAFDRERARKRVKMQHEDPNNIAGGNAGEGGIGGSNSETSKGKGKSNIPDPVAEEEKRQAAETKRLAEEEEPDWEAELKDVLDPDLLADEGCNPSGLYELFGVITHQGSGADSGHYCAYVKNDKSDNNMWYFFNDDSVTEVDQNKIESLSGGGEAHSALLLLYRALPLKHEPKNKK
ncbi:cysteine proteinase [Ascodesmis nigricans]|uniref:Ubiquitin carboxyl-terminal hydrolase n=1 Tax=Ascodesmis nigricans TaxID=341454 RepID=A0A4S2N5W3_9PEZI|nr:cysteine proteinase [Ascodesmis nigricans]